MSESASRSVVERESDGASVVAALVRLELDVARDGAARAASGRGRRRRSGRRSRRPAAARDRSGVSYWARTPPSRRIAIRSPSLIASSMSCVTKITVLRTSLVEAEELVLEAVARDRVEGAEGLVHQHHRRVGRERAGEPDALALAAGELRRDSGSRYSRGRGRRARAARRRARDPLLRASRAGAAPWRCCPRPSCAGTGRPAGSRSRCRAAARTSRSRDARPVDRGCRPRRCRSAG